MNIKYANSLNVIKSSSNKFWYIFKQYFLFIIRLYKNLQFGDYQKLFKGYKKFFINKKTFKIYFFFQKKKKFII